MSLEQKLIYNSPPSLQDQCIESICKTYFYYYEELNRLLPPMLKEKLTEAAMRCYESYDEDTISGRSSPYYSEELDRFLCSQL
jgi:hypothetical protein